MQSSWVFAALGTALSVGSPSKAAIPPTVSVFAPGVVSRRGKDVGDELGDGDGKRALAQSRAPLREGGNVTNFESPHDALLATPRGTRLKRSSVLNLKRRGRDGDAPAGAALDGDGAGVGELMRHDRATVAAPAAVLHLADERSIGAIGE